MPSPLTPILALAALLATTAAAPVPPAAAPPHAWLTTADRSQLLAPMPLSTAPASGDATRVTLNPKQRFQPVTGFGFALTGGSAELIQRMSPPARARLLRELFGHGADGIGVSWLRISIGSSDMDGGVFTYDDRPAGQTDSVLAHFSLAPDRRWLIPTLREILAIAPDLPILASPWSPPDWMKTNARPKGGSLRPDMGDVFARYLVRYVEGMRAEGVPIWGVTLQNEPENPKNTPSMLMTAPEQAALIGGHVGPAFRRAGLATRIVAFDHNVDHPDYALTVEGDPAAAPFVAGAGFHLYEGSVDAMTRVHDAHPDKPVWLTEQMVIDDVRTGRPTPAAEPVSRVAIAALANWAQGVLLWNLAADPAFGPHTGDGGCPICEGAVTLEGDRVTRNVAYATIAHFSRFVPPGSWRIASHARGGMGVASVAFRRPDGGLVVIVANPAAASATVVAGPPGRDAAVAIPAGGVVTLTWPASAAGS